MTESAEKVSNDIKFESSFGDNNIEHIPKKDDITIEELEAEREKAMKELIKNDEMKKNNEQEKLISDFKKMLGVGTTPISRKERQSIFETAMKEAEDMLYSCTIKTAQDIAALFDVDIEYGKKVKPDYPNYYWHINFPFYKNKIPLPAEVKKPTRRNKKTEKMEDYHFTITRFYASEHFVKRCNEYFKDFNIKISFEQVYTNPRYKNNWKIQMDVLGDGLIDFTNVKEDAESTTAEASQSVDEDDNTSIDE